MLGYDKSHSQNSLQQSQNLRNFEYIELTYEARDAGGQGGLDNYN
jgi:hypothetical protein